MKKTMRTTPTASFRSPRSFTIIELLVVIGIIAILASLLLPALAKAKASARRIACVNNGKELDLGYMLYAQNWGDYLVPPVDSSTTKWATEPNRGNWGYLVLPYVKEEYGIFKCPSAPEHPSWAVQNDPKTEKLNSWVLNFYLGYGGWSYTGGTSKVFKLSGIKSPGHCVSFFEKPFCDCTTSIFYVWGNYLPVANPNDPMWLGYPHSELSLTYSTLFADGHVEALKREQLHSDQQAYLDPLQ